MYSAGIKCNCTGIKKFVGNFSQPLITGELLDLKKKEKKKELAKSYGGRNSLTLRSVPTLDRA